MARQKGGVRMESRFLGKIPNPNIVFPNDYKTSCFLKNVITAQNISVGDYTYYDDSTDPTRFERDNVLFNYPEFGDRLIIGPSHHWEVLPNRLGDQVYHGPG